MSPQLTVTRQPWSFPPLLLLRLYHSRYPEPPWELALKTFHGPSNSPNPRRAYSNNVVGNGSGRTITVRYDIHTVPSRCRNIMMRSLSQRGVVGHDDKRGSGSDACFRK